MSGTKLRNYCFTYFGEELEISEDSDIKYCIFQKEKCPDTGRIHFQGYVELTKPMRIKAVQELLGIEKAHLEKRMGSREQAKAYCSKEDTRVDGPWEVGNFGSTQGKRNDLTALKKDILDPKSNICDVVIKSVENYQQLRFVEGLMKYRQPYVGVRCVKWFYGPTGVKKSYTASIEAGDYDEITYTNGGFWIGYRGNKNVVINDIRGNVPLNELLRITDRYKLYINIKGGECAWEAVNIWITCNVHPESLYQNCGERVDQLVRRISEIRKFGDGTRDEVGGNTETPTLKDCLPIV